MFLPVSLSHFLPFFPLLFSAFLCLQVSHSFPLRIFTMFPSYFLMVSLSLPVKFLILFPSHFPPFPSLCFSPFPTHVSQNFHILFPALLSSNLSLLFPLTFLTISSSVFSLFSTKVSYPFLPSHFSPTSTHISHTCHLTFSAFFSPHISSPTVPVSDCFSSVLDELLFFYSCNSLLTIMGARAALQEAPACASAGHKVCAQLEESR